MKHETTGRTSWILAAGVALAGLGLVAVTAQTPTSTRSLPAGGPSFATADSNDTMIAVTGIDVTGSSILYVIDTEARHLAVYEATGGADSTMGVKFVGGRKIDLDLKVDGYNDRSELSYKQLAEEFKKLGGSEKSDEENR
jgi:hypothetical protein